MDQLSREESPSWMFASFERHTDFLRPIEYKLVAELHHTRAIQKIRYYSQHQTGKLPYLYFYRLNTNIADSIQRSDIFP